MRRLVAIGMALTLALALGAGCGVDVPDDGGGGDGMVALLGRVPATGDTGAFVVLNLHDRAREAAGLAVPARDEGAAVDDYRQALTFDPTTGLLLRPAPVTGAQSRSLAEWRAELGFDLLDVDADAVAGSPPGEVEVVLGSIGAGDVEAAARADPVWSDRLEVGDRDGATLLSWGDEDGVEVERRTAARPVGESVRMAVDGGAVAWASRDAVIEATVDAWHGEADSLADVDELADLAEVLDAEGCHAAFLTTDDPHFDRAALPQPAPDGAAVLPRWEAAATGVTIAPGDPAVVVALRYGSADQAAGGAAALERVVAEGSSVVGGRRWSDVFTATDVRTDGAVVVGVLTTDQARLWYDLPSTRDTLLLWG